MSEGSGISPGVAVGIACGLIFLMVLCCVINACNRNAAAQQQTGGQLQTGQRDGDMVVFDAGTRAAEVAIQVQPGCCCGGGDGGGGDGGADGGGCGGGCGGGD